MTNLLLLGAGFSRNWGGWLANEVRSDIAMRLEGDQYLSEILNQHDSFEDALQQVQVEFVTSRNSNQAADRLRTLQAAITDTFEDMNKALSRKQFEFHNEVDCSVGLYLTKFDAIFTLNQDLLMERHYLHPWQNILARSGGKIPGATIPGMEEIPDSNYHGDERALYARWQPKQPPFDWPTNFQPYFKLHGSTNWFSSNGEQLIVMGGDKFSTILRHAVLNWYAQKFQDYLSAPSARLTVIGYGFRDQHINFMLHQAWQKSRFPMMIVGPDGREVLRKVNPTYGKMYLPGPLEEITSYDSTRPLSTTFGGNDPGELGKLYRFLMLNH
jgi:SIR2-like domain